MPHRNNQNAPYNLTTEHGRAQSAAHSTHGAFLAGVVETALDQQAEKTATDLETLLDKAMAVLTPSCITSDELMVQLANFQAELGVRDKEEFGPIVQAYIEERVAVRADMQHLVNLVSSVRKLFNLEEE